MLCVCKLIFASEDICNVYVFFSGRILRNILKSFASAATQLTDPTQNIFIFVLIEEHLFQTCKF